MHPGAALLIVVLVVVIIYLLFYKSTDKKFIASVDLAQQACDAALASQSDTDFTAALNAIALAKLARSDSLNQYDGGKVVPAEVTEASTKLDNISCSRYSDEIAIVALITTAAAACTAAGSSPTSDNVKTAAAAYNAASNAIKSYSGDVITTGLKTAIAAFNALKCTATISINTIPAPATDSTVTTGNITSEENLWQTTQASCPTGKTMQLTSFAYKPMSASSCAGYSDSGRLANLQSSYVSGGTFKMTRAFNDALGDPCPNEYKKFLASYSCQ